MSKVLFISHDDGGYYEPTIEVEVIEESELEERKKKAHMGYYVCENMVKFANAVLGLSNDYSQFKVDIDYLHALLNSKSYDVFDNYSLIQELKTKAYELDLISEFREFFYHQEDGYGDFRQEIKVYAGGDMVDMSMYPPALKEYIVSKIPRRLIPLFSNDDYKTAKINKMKDDIYKGEFHLEHLKLHAINTKRDIDVQEKYLASMVETLRKLEEELQ